MQCSTPKSTSKWIDEEVYRSSVLSLPPCGSESEADENLQRDARELGLVPDQKTLDVSDIASSLSATTIASEPNQGSIISQSTAPTSCGSSERRPSTSLSSRSARGGSHFEMPAIVTDMERKRHAGFKSGLRKMTNFRRKKISGSNTPSMVSVKSQVTGTAATGSISDPSKGAVSIKSGRSSASHDSPSTKDIFETEALVDEQARQRSMECQQLLDIRARQLDEKRRFLEYQTRLVKQLLDERDGQKAGKREKHAQQIADLEAKNEKAVEALEARQLEDELKQQTEHELAKRSIQTRLKHMEAYCHTPSPPQSPLQLDFDYRPSVDSIVTLPERQVTQQHYENLAQAYHDRDNMANLHASKINVLRGKQKRALQNFVTKKEREIEQMENEHEKELDSTDLEYARLETEIREEFETKRIKLEARWKLQALIERTRVEKSTGLKHQGLPDISFVEA
ncbi:hypothetical protein PMZ80_008798 [Knufia obscura]|nr:hypothetical protein PMZ80_008798 [Knufia obscura]